MDLALQFHRVVNTAVLWLTEEKEEKGEAEQLLVQSTYLEQLYLAECHFWAWPTSSDWWETGAMQNWGYQQWQQNFWLIKATFLEICVELTLELHHHHTNMTVAPNVKKCDVTTIWKVATPYCYQSVASQFGVGRAVVIDVCNAMERVLLCHVIKLGNTQEVIDSFAKIEFIAILDPDPE